QLDAAAAAGDEPAVRRGGVSRGSGGRDTLDRVGRRGRGDARRRAPRRARDRASSRSARGGAHALPRSAAAVPVTLGWRVPGPALGSAPPVRPGVTTALATPAINPIVRWAFALLVFSIPFEFPERSFPIEIPTITAAVFLLTTPLALRACYARRPAALVWFLLYLYAFAVSAVWNARHAAATDVNNANYGAEVTKLFALLLQAVLVFWAAYNLFQSPRIARLTVVVLALAGTIRALLPVVGIARTTHAIWGGGRARHRPRAERQQQCHDPRRGVRGAARAPVRCRATAAAPALAGRADPRPARPLRRGHGLARRDRGAGCGAAPLHVQRRAHPVAGSAQRRHRGARDRAGHLRSVPIGRGTAPLHRIGRRRIARRTRADLSECTADVPRSSAHRLGPVNNKYELGLRLNERIFRRRDAHNLVLEVLSSTGLAGTIPFLAGLGLCCVGAWRARRGPHGILPLALLLVVVAANMSGNWIASK